MIVTVLTLQELLERIETAMKCTVYPGAQILLLEIPGQLTIITMGLFQDYTYFYKGWKAIADKLISDNGVERGGVINNSWGTNIRIGVLEQYRELFGQKGWMTVNSKPTVSEAQEALKNSTGTAETPEVGDIGFPSKAISY